MPLTTNVIAGKPRFYLQEPHIDGLAVLDRYTSSLVISSFGDTSDQARGPLEAVAACLNAATDETYPAATNEFKRLERDAPMLVWRVVEWLAHIIRAQKQAYEDLSERNTRLENELDLVLDRDYYS